MEPGLKPSGWRERAGGGGMLPLAPLAPGAPLDPGADILGPGPRTGCAWRPFCARVAGFGGVALARLGTVVVWELARAKGMLKTVGAACAVFKVWSELVKTVGKRTFFTAESWQLPLLAEVRLAPLGNKP